MAHYSSSRPLVAGLLIFILTSVGLGIYNFVVSNTIKQKITIVEEGRTKAESLQKDAEEFKTQVDAMTVNAEENREKVAELRSRADELSDRLDALTAKKATLSQTDYRSKLPPLVKEFNTLKARYKDIKSQNASLILNQDTLQNKLDVKKDTLQKYDSSRQQLAETLAKRRYLKVYGIDVKTYTFNIFNKKKTTDNADAVLIFDVCATLEENPVISKGKKVIYMRIEGPDGSALGKNPKNMFLPKESKKKIGYTRKKELEYTGQQQEVCLEYELDRDVFTDPGTYKVEYYHKRRLLGSEEFTLK